METLTRIRRVLENEIQYKNISVFVLNKFHESSLNIDYLVKIISSEFVEDLAHVKSILMQHEGVWADIHKHWVRKIVKSILPPDAVRRGGDRKSHAARGRQQKAIIHLAEEHARNAAPTVADQTIVEEVMATVQQRWSIAMDGTTVVERVLQVIVRQTRCSSQPTDEDEIEDGDDVQSLMELFDRQELVERGADNANTPIHIINSCFDQIPNHLRTPEVVIGVVNFINTQAETERLRAETQLVCAQREPDRLTAETQLVCAKQEPDRLRADTERIKAETERIKAETRRIIVERQPTTRKRKRSDEDVEAESRSPWHGLQSLSAVVWHARSQTNPELSMRAVYEDVARLAPQSFQKTRLRLIPPAVDDSNVSPVKVVYVPATVDADAWATDYWKEPKMITDGSVPTLVARTPARQVRLPVGSVDLVAAIAGTEGFEMTPDRIKRLDDKFVHSEHMARTWAVLWPSSRPKDHSIIPTYIDVERDPIVGELRDWLCRSDVDNDSELPPPSYPANLNADMRPLELVPFELQALPINTVWPMLQRAGIGRAFNSRLLAAYEATADRADDIEAAHPPCQERLRQWRRLSDDATCDGELTFRQIVECLGWRTVERECRNVQVLTAVLVAQRQNNMPPSAWYYKRGSANVWKFRICLPEMRLAAIFVSRLLLGGADIRYLANDIQHLPQPTAKTVS